VTTDENWVLRGGWREIKLKELLSLLWLRLVTCTVFINVTGPYRRFRGFGLAAMSGCALLLKSSRDISASEPHKKTWIGHSNVDCHCVGGWKKRIRSFLRGDSKAECYAGCPVLAIYGKCVCLCVCVCLSGCYVHCCTVWKQRKLTNITVCSVTHSSIMILNEIKKFQIV